MNQVAALTFWEHVKHAADSTVGTQTFELMLCETNDFASVVTSGTRKP